MIRFTNPGEIDPRLITTLGVNVKESENPVGYFGTGLKYAIAVTLREGCKIEIWSGQNQYTFSTDTEEVRGKAFDFIYMDHTDESGRFHERLGFTTELGKNWTLDHAYRELHCNALDESGTVGHKTQAMPSVGWTHVVVTGAKFEEVHARRYEFILDPSRSPIYKTKECEIYQGRSSQIFYRGIAASSPVVETSVTYNFLKQVDLTEDRTIRYDWDIGDIISKVLSKGECPASVLEDALATKDVYEQAYVHFSFTDVSDHFIKVVGDLIRRKPATVNANAAEHYFRKHGKSVNYRERAFTPAQSADVEAARTWMKALGFEQDFPVKLVEDLGKGTIAAAVDGTIWLTQQAFGRDTLKRAMLEEYVHLAFKCSDYTRQMQNALFTELVRLGDLIAGG